MRLNVILYRTSCGGSLTGPSETTMSFASIANGRLRGILRSGRPPSAAIFSMLSFRMLARGNMVSAGK